MAMKATQPRHVHKLKRHSYRSGSSIYFCALPDCSFKVSVPLALGKRTLCWRCGDSFTMTEYAIRLAKPHCEACHKPKIKIIEIPTNGPLHHDMYENDNKISDTPLTLAERLTHTIQSVTQREEDEGEI